MSNRLPESEAVTPTPVPFVVVPVPQIVGAAPLTMQQALYQLALQQAQEKAAQQARYGKDWLGGVN